MSDFVLSPRARADLDGIWDYSAAQWGDDRAERYVREIWRAITTVAANSRRATACDHIRPGYFKFAVGAHVLFFRMEQDHLDIVRILHARMDFDQHL